MGRVTMIKLEPIKVLTPNGFSHGLATKLQFQQEKRAT